MTLYGVFARTSLNCLRRVFTWMDKIFCQLASSPLIFFWMVNNGSYLAGNCSGFMLGNRVACSYCGAFIAALAVGSCEFHFPFISQSLGFQVRLFCRSLRRSRSLQWPMMCCIGWCVPFGCMVLAVDFVMLLVMMLWIAELTCGFFFLVCSLSSSGFMFVPLTLP